MIMQQVDAAQQIQTIKQMCEKVLDHTTLYDCMSKCLAEEIIRYLNS